MLDKPRDRKPKITIEIVDPNYSDAEICRKNGWTVGTRLVGDEGYGPTVIEITGLGERQLLAKTISHNGIPDDYSHEGSWTLSCRKWRKLEEVGDAKP